MVRFLMWCRHKLAVAIPRIIQITIVGHQTAPLFWRAPVTARIRLAAWRIRMRLTMSDMDSSYGSRLAFHGTVSELAPRQFKRLRIIISYFNCF